MKKILSVSTFAIMAAFVLISVAPLTYAQGKGQAKSDASVEASGNGRAYGHFIAPGWLKKNERPSTVGVVLPFGITKKVDKNPGPVDTTAPVLSNIVTSADYDSTLITWITNEAGNSTVYISTSTPVVINDGETYVFASSSLGTSHSVTATGLEASTIYYALVTSRDSSGNTSTSSQFSFVTSPAPDTTDPIISAIALGVSSTTLQVNWVTNEPATSRVYVSTSTGFGIGDVGVIGALDANLATSHQLMVTGLTASSTYYLRIRSIDAAFNATVSNEITFTTQ